MATPCWCEPRFLDRLGDYKEMVTLEQHVFISVCNRRSPLENDIYIDSFQVEILWPQAIPNKIHPPRNMFPWYEEVFLYFTDVIHCSHEVGHWFIWDLSYLKIDITLL